MDRDKALKLIEEKVSNKNIIKHMLATEAVMGELAKKLEPESIDDWKMAGLLHDGDYRDDVPVEKQGIQVGEWATKLGIQISDEVKHAMAAHNFSNTGVAPESKMDWAIFACDSLTGLIVAAALVLPSKKLSDVTPETVLRRFKEPKFAAGTRREDIITCEKQLGIPLEEFVKISLEAMQKIAPEIGL